MMMDFRPASIHGHLSVLYESGGLRTRIEISSLRLVVMQSVGGCMARRINIFRGLCEEAKVC